MTKRHVCFLVAVLVALALGGQALAHPGGVNEPSPDLPPVIVPGVYLSPSDVHAKYSGPGLEVVLSMVEHQPFAALPPEYLPDGEHHRFNSHLQAQVSINGDAPIPFLANGMVQTVAFARSPGQTGTFDTEMLSMSLAGGPVMIRESPTKASLGKTSIDPIGGGMFHIDSFFDVFTELSLDGGATWIPKAGPRGTLVVLGGVPEPASLALLGLGVVGFVGFVRRR